MPPPPPPPTPPKGPPLFWPALQARLFRSPACFKGPTFFFARGVQLAGGAAGGGLLVRGQQLGAGGGGRHRAEAGGADGAQHRGGASEPSTRIRAVERAVEPGARVWGELGAEGREDPPRWVLSFLPVFFEGCPRIFGLSPGVFLRGSGDNPGFFPSLTGPSFFWDK